MPKTKLIVDGNLFGRKMFYKFRHLSTKVHPKNLPIILPTVKTKSSPIKNVTIVNEGTGDEIRYKDGGRIEQKIADIMVGNEPVSVMTGLAFGTLRSLIANQRDRNIGEIVFCFDPLKRDRTTSKRLEIDKDYKISRKEDSRRKKKDTSEFYAQLSLVHNILYIMGIRQVWTKSFEADDLLQFFCQEIFPNDPCLMLTSDHDLFQAISDKDSVLIIGAKGGVFGKKEFRKKFKLRPKQWLDVMTLCGCSGDDVKGIPGIGEDTAIALIQEAGDILGVFRKAKLGTLSDKRAMNIIIKEIDNDLVITKKTRGLVKLYGSSPKLRKELINLKKKRGKGDLQRIKACLEVLRFKSMLGDKELGILENIMKNQRRKKNANASN